MTKINEQVTELNHEHLEDAKPYFDELMEDPELKRIYEEESLKIQVAQAIHQKRKELKLSQKVLAERAKTTQKVISKIEHAEVSVGLDLLQRIAMAMNARFSFTFG